MFLLTKLFWILQVMKSYIVANSANRNTTVYPSTSQFRIDFLPRVRNVKQIKLISATFPNKNNVLNQPGLLLRVNFGPVGGELLKDADQTLDFCFLPLIKSTSAFVYVDQTALPYTKELNETHDIGYVSIQLCDIFGTTFSFANPGGVLDLAYQSHFVFELEHE